MGRTIPRRPHAAVRPIEAGVLGIWRREVVDEPTVTRHILCLALRASGYAAVRLRHPAFVVDNFVRNIVDSCRLALERAARKGEAQDGPNNPEKVHGAPVSRRSSALGICRSGKDEPSHPVPHSSRHRLHRCSTTASCVRRRQSRLHHHGQPRSGSRQPPANLARAPSETPSPSPLAACPQAASHAAIPRWSR
jgi:hypothetical protein